ncbi:hypothetical protein [Aliivibrio fischeri]|uniref:Uncharacterized protein n=1 Tax=Aliivibrio fischeri TaxID=668 RepID=A0A510UF86_ALIFS|nr:hypothetical protein [Aliivibrio fischeri]GEK13206.1 hypothetical protein AFI02nite_12420 [Aliivibrio fischeri]
MNALFIELQKAAGLSNFSCGEYLGISEGAVLDRRRNIFKPKRSEIIALAIYGSDAEAAAVSLIQKNCSHIWRDVDKNGNGQRSTFCAKCRLEKK